MSEQFLEQLDPSRRAFVKKLIAAGAAAPVIASFSMDALAQTPANPSSSLSSSASSLSACQIDPGYSGPGRFAAHLAYGGYNTDYGARVNGEILLVVNNDGDDDRDDHKAARNVSVDIDLVPGVVLASAQILINGSVAVNLPTANYRFNATDVQSGFCDLDFVLNAMASGQATVVALVTYNGTPLNLVGPVAPAGPGFDFVNLKG